MPIVICPTCAARLDVPSDRAGKKVTCARCKVHFVVQVETAIPDSPQGEFFEQLDADSRTFKPPRGGMRPNEPPGRYPNLLKYLQWQDEGARIVMMLSVALSAIALVGAIVFMVQQHEPLILFFAMLGSVILVGLAYMAYVWTKALTEFVRVIIDIERGIRSLDDRAAAAPH